MNNLWLGLMIWIIILSTIKALSMIDNYLDNQKRNKAFEKANREQWRI